MAARAWNGDVSLGMLIGGRCTAKYKLLPASNRVFRV